MFDPDRDGTSSRRCLCLYRLPKGVWSGNQLQGENVFASSLLLAFNRNTSKMSTFVLTLPSTTPHVSLSSSLISFSTKKSMRHRVFKRSYTNDKRSQNIESILDKTHLSPSIDILKKIPGHENSHIFMKIRFLHILFEISCCKR